MRILVTGAAGFIGTALCRRLVEDEHEVVACGRSRPELPGILFVPSPELGPEADWAAALDGAEIVVHLAARAHFVGEKDGHETEALYHRVNTEGTAGLVRQAVATGIRHFIFISSIGALAGSSETKLPVITPCRPVTHYGVSKLNAEHVLKEIAEAGGMAWTIIRPTLVYGPRNPGNMARLLKIADSGFPIPLSALDSNRRSFVGVSNLIDFMLLCLNHPASVNQTFHVSDDDDISTAELLRRMGKALGKPICNLPIPEPILNAALRLLGKGDWVDKLCGDLRVDISETKRLLGWKAKMTMEEELEQTAKWWRTRNKSGD